MKLTVKSKVPVIVWIALLASSGIAKADSALNCNAYAQTAVNQQAMNLKLQCGFKGGAWSSNFGGHAAWCQRQHVKMVHLTDQQKLRKAALMKCSKQKGPLAGMKKAAERRAQQLSYCKKYATQAQSLRKLVVKHCGKSNEWPASWKQDLAHCRKVGGASADIKNKNREERARQCRTSNSIKVLKQSDLRHKHSRYGWLNYDTCSHSDRGAGPGLYNTCGRKWAHEICKRKGFKKATSHATRPNDKRASSLGVKADGPSTWWLGAKKICHGKCYHFTTITCVGAK